MTMFTYRCEKKL